jgi:tetratricopeptide (TPR) repeat protein
VCPDDAIPDASESQPFEKLIIETACLARIGGADEARLRLAAAGYGESYARLLAAQALFVDGKVDEAIAAFEELAREDPADYRPLFCQGVLYLVLGREAESESMLERCREVGGDTLIVDPAVMITPTVDAESGEEKSEPEPEPAKV